MRRPIGTLALAAALSLAALPTTAIAAELAGWHIVRKGESLIRITVDYLGSSERWRENWRLNPEIDNPDLLLPGQRIRVLLSPPDSIPTARLATPSGQVDERPLPLGWDTARRDDLLVERDGLRTRENSSVEMTFTDGTSLVVSEDSLIFLRLPGSRKRTVGPGQVEILEGQADLEASPVSSAAVDVEILVAGARATPDRGDSGRSQTRARKSGGGGAEIMVYEGNTRVEAAGASVAVPRGMGTAVPKDAPPSPPEPLLPAPSTVAPAAGSSWAFPDPEFRWQPVAGAASYTVEVCRDRACSGLVERATGLAASVWRPAGLPVDAFFWRVTAVSASGLDGYPSPPVAFAVLNDRPDAEPPHGTLTVSGRHLEVAGRPLYRGDASVVVEVTDDGAGVAGWEAVVDGAVAGRERLAGPWKSGTHTVSVRARDRFGHEAEIGPLSFRVDADAPALEWGAYHVKPLLAKVRRGMAGPAWRRAKHDWARWALAEFRGDPEGPAWLVLAWGDAEHEVADSWVEDAFAQDRGRAVRRFDVPGNRPEVMVMAPGLRPEGEPAPLVDGRFVWIYASDAGSGEVRGLHLRTEPAPAGGAGFQLVVETEDALGNAARLAWPFE